ncbi:MAG: substrate-binding domain-containing protein [Desulfobacteraceae bacterium]|nr:substrate-binding domain-containing protein [Desulfobacteraceae bacterium]
MKRLSTIIKLFLLMGISAAVLATSGWAADDNVLMMATTTSTNDTGLLDYLAPHFNKASGLELRWTATGTGKALELGKNCDVDVLLVHSPEAELKFVEEGYGIHRTPIMYNDFVIIGPAADPAGIKGKSVAESLAAIMAKKAVFVSRGDKSGTHNKELELWKTAKLTLPEKESWYVQSGQGMLATINMAFEKKGYTLTDRGTYIKYEADKGGQPPMVILVEGDETLRNQYSVIVVNQKRCEKAKSGMAQKFAFWMSGPQGQMLIKEFTQNGKQLFTPNAK